jgi:hypothetical protein
MSAPFFLPHMHMAFAVPRDDDDDDLPKVHATTAPTAAAETSTVKLSRDGQDKGGIAVAEPAPAPFQDRARVYATVLPLDRLTALFNASLAGAAQMQAAQAKRVASQSAEARAQALLKVFPTAKAQAETATAAAETDAAGVAAVIAQSDALHNTAIQDWGPVLGNAVASRAQLASDLVARRTVLVQVAAEPGATVTPPVHLAFGLSGDKSVEGHLVSESAQVDPKVQTVGYLYAVPAASGLVPGASLLASWPKGTGEPGLSIPASAIVWQDGKPWIYVRTTPDRFERRPLGELALPVSGGGYVVPATSLAGRGEKALVTVGAQMLLSQELRAQIPSDEDGN